MVEFAYSAIALIGILHGLEPGHGWPVAMLYASDRPHPLTRALLLSWIISMAHLVSSVTVFAAYAVLEAYLGFSMPYINIVAGIALAILGVRFLVEKTEGWS